MFAHHPPRRCRGVARRPSFLTTTMSFARALVAAGPSARLAAGRVAATRSLAFAYRWHSTAPRHQQVDPTISNKPHDYLEPGPPIRSPPTKTAGFTAADEPGKDYDPYKDGPSAIDKAVHLFFFTEIIRGASCVQGALSGRIVLSVGPRHVAGVGAILPTALHYHVPVREGPSLPPFPRRACSA